MNQPESIAPATGKLGVLIPGMGAVATTVIAGVEAIKAGIGQPIGSLTQMGTIRLGKRTEGRSPLIKDFVPLADIDSLVFGGWDVFPEDAYDSAIHAGVLDKRTARPASGPAQGRQADARGFRPQLRAPPRRL